MLLGCAASFGLAVSVASRRFGQFALAAASVGMSTRRQKRRKIFRGSAIASALRRKEWTLLVRDPWLVSQTLMQILYLIPPGLLLWHKYGEDAGGLAVLAPVLVMAGGQLAGGLAWLAISGEDAPDLIHTAPVRWSAILRAKIEAVIGAVVVVLCPILLALAAASLRTALITTLGVLVAAASATAVQLIFRAPAKRGNLRRRHTSSRFATFAEAFSSIGWAATAGLAVGSNPLAGLTALLAVMVVILAAMFTGTWRARSAGPGFGSDDAADPRFIITEPGVGYRLKG
jgi:ABC-2 type transport system permease protein